MRCYVVNIKHGDEYDVYIGRPTVWGCPESIEYSCKTREEVLIKYKEWLFAQPELVERARTELTNKVLGCYCIPTKKCHGEILAKIANGEL